MRSIVDSFQDPRHSGHPIMGILGSLARPGPVTISDRIVRRGVASAQPRLRTRIGPRKSLGSTTRPPCRISTRSRWASRRAARRTSSMSWRHSLSPAAACHLARADAAAPVTTGEKLKHRVIELLVDRSNASVPTGVGAVAQLAPLNLPASAQGDASPATHAVLLNTLLRRLPRRAFGIHGTQHGPQTRRATATPAAEPMATTRSHRRRAMP